MKSKIIVKETAPIGRYSSNGGCGPPLAGVSQRGWWVAVLLPHM